jgi:heterodisulfide reductase subunit A-like polyferredoxin
MVENTRKGDFEQMAVTVDASKCTKEAECPAAAACPFDALVQSEGGTVPTVDEDTCSDCGICVDECPAGALLCE